MDLKVNDAVTHLATGITGTVTWLGIKSVLIQVDEGWTLVPRVMVTVRVTMAAFHGQFTDFPIDQVGMV